MFRRYVVSCLWWENTITSPVIFLGIYLIAVFFLLCSALVWWLYYIRTKKILYKLAALNKKEAEELVTRHFARIEHRMAQGHEMAGIPNGQFWLVVCTLNRKEYLAQALQSLRQYEPECRLLVVDNGSTDGTREYLARCMEDGTVNKVLLNRYTDVPQWQKAYGLQQAFRLLALEECEYVGWMDDDVRVYRPFVATVRNLLASLEKERVRLVSLLTDERQNAVHETLEHRTVDGTDVRIKNSFNGAFVCFRAELLREIGLPPLREGCDNLASEDWYYSRLFGEKKFTVAALDFAEHMGAQDSMRVQTTHGEA